MDIFNQNNNQEQPKEVKPETNSNYVIEDVINEEDGSVTRIVTPKKEN